MTSDFTLRQLHTDPAILESLAELIISIVAGGGSVSFMHPLSKEEAMRFWRNALLAADNGSRVILGAYENDQLVGTATLLLDCPPNQPHRAEIAKMMTAPAARGKGIARTMLLELERIAMEKGRTLINLDTAAEEGAANFYEKMGYQQGGVIPRYAYKPHGGLTDTIIYWKWMGA